MILVTSYGPLGHVKHKGPVAAVTSAPASIEKYNMKNSATQLNGPGKVLNCFLNV